MKRNNLTTAVIAGIAGIAGFANLTNAVELNPDGIGQVLIYPYFTVEKSQQTYLSIVNTDTNNAKAVKVRFLEGENSREVLDFNLFLSHDDVWTATIFSLSDAGEPGAGAAIVTDDTSCTAPYIFGGGNGQGNIGTLDDGRSYARFVNYAFVGADEDTGSTSETRTREGHFEIIQMVDIPPGTSLYNNITHANGIPADADCSSVQGLNAATTAMTLPTGGLFGSVGIINVEEGTMFPYNAEAIDGFYTNAGTPTGLYTGQGSTSPSLADADNGGATAVSYVFLPGGQLLTSSYLLGSSIDAVSVIFMGDTIYNEYNVDSSIGANTDWVVTFPTKRFYVDNTTIAIRPFEEYFGEVNDGLSCAQVGITQYDREEGFQESQDGFSPPPPTGPASALCKETNVISFLSSGDPDAGVTSPVLGSTLVTNVEPYGNAGWMRLDLTTSADPTNFPHETRSSIDGDIYHGLPVTGFEAVNVINANATPGMLANYGGLWRHRLTRTCTNTQTVCS